MIVNGCLCCYSHNTAVPIYVMGTPMQVLMLMQTGNHSVDMRYEEQHIWNSMIDISWNGGTFNHPRIFLWISTLKLTLFQEAYKLKPPRAVIDVSVCFCPPFPAHTKPVLTIDRNLWLDNCLVFDLNRNSTSVWG